MVTQEHTLGRRHKVDAVFELHRWGHPRIVDAERTTQVATVESIAESEKRQGGDKQEQNGHVQTSS